MLLQAAPCPRSLERRRAECGPASEQLRRSFGPPSLLRCPVLGSHGRQNSCWDFAVLGTNQPLPPSGQSTTPGMARRDSTPSTAIVSWNGRSRTGRGCDAASPLQTQVSPCSHVPGNCEVRWRRSCASVPRRARAGPRRRSGRRCRAGGSVVRRPCHPPAPDHRPPGQRPRDRRYGPPQRPLSAGSEEAGTIALPLVRSATDRIAGRGASCDGPTRRQPTPPPTSWSWPSRPASRSRSAFPPARTVPGGAR